MDQNERSDSGLSVDVHMGNGNGNSRLFMIIHVPFAFQVYVNYHGDYYHKSQRGTHLQGCQYADRSENTFTLDLNEELHRPVRDENLIKTLKHDRVIDTFCRLTSHDTVQKCYITVWGCQFFCNKE